MDTVDAATNRLYHVRNQLARCRPWSPYGKRLYVALRKEYARCIEKLRQDLADPAANPTERHHAKLDRLCVNLEWCIELEQSRVIPQCGQLLEHLQMLHVERLWFVYGMNLKPDFRAQHEQEWKAASFKADWSREFEVILGEKRRCLSLPPNANPEDLAPGLSRLQHLSKLLGEEPDDQFFDLLCRYVQCDLEANSYLGEGAVVTRDIALRDHEMVNSRFPPRFSFMVPYFRAAIIDFLENEIGVFIREPNGYDSEEWNLLTEVPRLGPVARLGRLVDFLD
ncbi:hypothetical protein F5X99DRAFT_48693 [Biscogniauxia marginata]|nr:hypothetical protein F5X99DRAFT_48693 [Biscogniauxia marginata]